MPVRIHPLFRGSDPQRLVRIELDEVLIIRLRETAAILAGDTAQLGRCLQSRSRSAKGLNSLTDCPATTLGQDASDILSSIVNKLQSPIELRSLLRTLRRRLDDLRIAPTAYSDLTVATVASIRDLAGTRLTDDAAEDWRQTLELIASIVRSEITPP